MWYQVKLVVPVYSAVNVQIHVRLERRRRWERAAGRRCGSIEEECRAAI
jgi:hypothetical protein